MNFSALSHFWKLNFQSRTMPFEGLSCKWFIFGWIGLPQARINGCQMYVQHVGTSSTCSVYNREQGFRSTGEGDTAAPLPELHCLMGGLEFRSFATSSTNAVQLLENWTEQSAGFTICGIRLTSPAFLPSVVSQGCPTFWRLWATLEEEE